MKALSLWQPWASLVVAGTKHWETRSWSTDYRGLLAIHATKRVPKPFEDLLKAQSTPEAETLVKLMRQMGYYSLREMPMGKVIGLVTPRTSFTSWYGMPTWVILARVDSPGDWQTRLNSSIQFKPGGPRDCGNGLCRHRQPTKCRDQRSHDVW
jgi:hypothetical protein